MQTRPKTKLTKELLDDINNAWLKTKGVDERFLINPLEILRVEDSDDFQKRLAWLFMQPEYFSFLCKVIMNIELLPMQALILCEMWNRKFPMLIGTRGFGKSWLLSLYCMLRALIMPNRKVVVVGAAFRQSKFLYEYMESMWKNAPILRDMCDADSGPTKQPDMCRMTLNGSIINCIPVGDGQKIRGLRANDIIADEFASMNREIFENVIIGFGMVSANPTENVKRELAKIRAEELNVDPSFLDEESINNKSNQVIISGTAYYDFNHFADYWKKWKKIIFTKGRKDKLRDLFGGDEPDPSFNWKDYSIIRIPYTLVPKGFLDQAQIARAKATIHNGIFLMEYSAVFATDSQGFFKRSLIESCVGTDSKPINLPSGPVYFDPMLKGVHNKKYVIGVDPASEIDNFAIVVVELNQDHRKIVHCWTTNKKDHTDRVSKGIAEENNYYSYCARKIRELMNQFTVVHIAMDSQGGGVPISEALHDMSQLRPGEIPIWPIIEEDKEKPSDDQPGLHIIELCNFAKAEWTSEANHGLRKDFEDKVTIFPRFDPITLGIAAEQDNRNNKLFDTLEDCVMEIEELKKELSLIEISQTTNGRDRWDTPEVKVGVGKKTRLRKDRYSALLMANMAARSRDFTEKNTHYASYGGFATSTGSQKKDAGYIGPNWFTSVMNDVY